MNEKMITDNYKLIRKLIAEANSGNYEIEIANLFVDAWQVINSLQNKISNIEVKLKQKKNKIKKLSSDLEEIALKNTKGETK